MHPAKPVTQHQAEAFLHDQIDPTCTHVVEIGAGAWSICYGFQRGSQQLVIRFGQHLEDFEKDQRAFRYATRALPIPEVLAIGPAFTGYYAISTRASGVALESLNATEWQPVIPQLVQVFEALRTSDISSTQGYGGWGASGNARAASWAAYLLAVAIDHPDERTYGWRTRMEALPDVDAAFRDGYALLERLASIPVIRCLNHCDLTNRNVLVDQGRITGVFDWGCSIYGDHLYDLALLEFWSPWYPALDMVAVRQELTNCWQRTGYTPTNLNERLLACCLHIGLGHIGYNIFTGDTENLSATIARMQAIIARYR